MTRWRGPQNQHRELFVSLLHNCDNSAARLDAFSGPYEMIMAATPHCGILREP
jgi:hypothetical protein